MKKYHWKGRLLFWLSLLSMLVFMVGFVCEVGVGQQMLYALLTTSLVFKLLKILFEWYHYVGLPDQDLRLIPPTPKKNFQVDMLTTACPGEPFDMISETLHAMVAVTYPHQNYLCDEGNDPELKALCKALGVIHVTRETHENAKAGNINHALQQATGEICVILDPDHAPFPEFLDHVLHHFEDPKIGYVQVVQAYKNQSETFVAQAAAEQTYTFYGPYMQAMSGYGTAQAIGANCTFRRSALDSIGGHAPGLTEDMHTSMLLHAKGWQSVYVPKILSLGLVPSSLPAYYKQQLKWSRGTFDLWFHLFPKLIPKFSWRQSLHYGLIPVYYLFGLIGLIDILVPIYSLLTGEYPWLLDPMLFFAYFTPLFVMSLAYRFYAQGWLNDPKEKGLHLMGGVLRVGTWWVFILGFVYTLLNIKVPYLPTPKEHSSKGEFILGLPNLCIALVSIAAAVYGLHWDWQPYSLLMAGFASLNALIFTMAFVIGQTDWVLKIKKSWKSIKTYRKAPTAQLTYVQLSRNAIPLVVVLVGLFSLYFVLSAFDFGNNDYLNPKVKSASEKNSGGFLFGIYHPEAVDEGSFSSVVATEREIETQWQIVSTYLSWGDGKLPVKLWDKIIHHGAIPMITWEPWSNLFAAYQDVEELQQNKKIFRYIVAGYFDDYIDHMAETLRELDSPVFLRFAHEMENPMYPWSETGGNTAEEFKEAWQYIHFRFEKMGAQNVSWVWSPWSVEGMEAYFPYGQDNAVDQYVDWISLTALNYGKASKDQSESDFRSIYEPFQKKIEELDLELPVMLAEFGSTSFEANGASWVNQSLATIQQSFPEIKSVVFFFSQLDRNWITDWRPEEKTSFIDWTFDLSLVKNKLNSWTGKPGHAFSTAALSQPDRPRNFFQKEEEGFVWQHKGNPFYIKGVCYNSGHDWEEGFVPLTRKQVKKDFIKIKAMGANTIRRYEPSFYDRNMLNEAKEQDLKVMYGFWFDPKVDYVKDDRKLKRYEERVLNQVKKHRDNPVIVAWNIGNETYGLLKKHHAQPYLTSIRRNYVLFLEGLARKIQEIDPSRPVFSSEEHDHVRLIGTLHDFKKYAPSLDAIGINSYYKENIEQLEETFTSIDTGRPYVITEFGPKGYWSKELGDFRQDSILLEVSSLAKANWYADQWKDHIQTYQGSNLGGFAFSWQDRFEGTATWFGLTDYEGRLKPAYYALQQAWKNQDLDSLAFPDIQIMGHWQAMEPGESIWLSAATFNAYPGTLSYSWKVYEENTWKVSEPIVSALEAQQYVEVKIPKNKSRIYVYATDSVGNVITASRRLLNK